MTARLAGLSHEYPTDLEILLVSPAGQGILLMSDAGGGTAISNVNLTFDDAAVAVLSDTSRILSGTYKPTDYSPPDDAIPAPAPGRPYGTNLSVFNGIDPNGPWSLYVSDDFVDFAGSISNGWSLTLTTLAPAVCCARSST